MVGDTSFDMPMARAAGVRAIGVGWGYHPVAAARAGRRRRPSSIASSSCSSWPRRRREAVLSEVSVASGGRGPPGPARRPAGADSGAAHRSPLPSAALAEAVADEWRAQGETIQRRADAADPAGRHGDRSHAGLARRLRSTRWSATPTPTFCAIAPPRRSSWPSASSDPGSRWLEWLRAQPWRPARGDHRDAARGAAGRRASARLRACGRARSTTGPWSACTRDHGARLRGPRPRAARRARSMPSRRSRRACWTSCSRSSAGAASARAERRQQRAAARRRGGGALSRLPARAGLGWSSPASLR